MNTDPLGLRVIRVKPFKPFRPNKPPSALDDLGRLFDPRPLASALWNFVTQDEADECPDEPVGSLKKSKDRWLKNNGVDPHELKDGIGDSRLDIYIDRDGNIWTLPKDGRGIQTTLRINK